MLPKTGCNYEEFPIIMSIFEINLDETLRVLDKCLVVKS